MIGQIRTGSNFGGLFRYLLSPEKGARILGGSAFGQTPAELTSEFNQCAKQRGTTQKPVKHIMVSFAPGDGEVSDEVKVTIGERVTLGLGYTDNQYIIIDHHRDDPGHDWNHIHDHFHIVSNMITLDGRRVDHGWEKYKTQEILRNLEKEFNLTQVASSWETDRKCPTHGQTQRYKKEKKQYEAGLRDVPPQPPVSEKLQDLIEYICALQPTMTEFVKRLQQQGVEVRPKITRNNIVQGISYCLDGVSFQGNKLGSASFPKLQILRGVDYDPERDLPALKKAAAGLRVESSANDNQLQSERVTEVAAIANAILYLNDTHYLEGNRFIALREGEILQLWEKGNEQPLMKACVEGETKTWNDTGTSQLTPEVVDYFRQHLSSLLEKARAKREEKQHSQQTKQKKEQLELH